MARVFAREYALWAMRPVKNLTLEAMIGKLSATFSQIREERAAERSDDSRQDTLMSGFALMFFQHPSLLQFQRAMKPKARRCNREMIFGVKAVPSDTPRREIVDGAPTAAAARSWCPNSLRACEGPGGRQ